MALLRLLHVAPYFERAWAYGGIPRVVGAEVRGLAARGHAVRVVTTDAGDARRRAPAVGAAGLPPLPDTVEVTLCPNLSNALAHRWQLFLPLGLGPALARGLSGVDLAHLHACHNLPVALAARRLWCAGVPYVVQPNGTAPRIERRRLAKALFGLVFERRLLRDAARVIAVSEAERRRLEALGVERHRLEIVPNPLLLAELPETPPPAEGRVVLYLGQLTPRKRVDLVVRAFAALGHADARLVVAGGDRRAERRLLALARRLGVAGRTRFVGVLRGRDRLDALARARVLAYPTEDEVFGLVPLEAILCGTPAIVAAGCGSAEIVARVGGGRIVPAGDVGALAEAMGRALSESRPADLEAAAGRVRALFGEAPVAERLERLYFEVLGGRCG